MATSTRTRTEPATKKPQRTLEDLATELERAADGFERARDPRCVFARAYATLTRALIAAMPEAGFADVGWVRKLALTFADYYLRALREQDAGTLSHGAWSSVFEAGRRGQTSVLEDLVLGMTAHIVNDLPRALCDVGMQNGHDRSHLADFHRLNDVLGGAIEDVQRDVTRRYDPLLHVLDQLFESYDEILTNYGLRLSRATAWYNAERLRDPQLRDDASRAIAQSPEITLREILDPPGRSLRILFRGARVLARATRRWPSARSETPARAPRERIVTASPAAIP